MTSGPTPPGFVTDFSCVLIIEFEKHVCFEPDISFLTSWLFDRLAGWPVGWTMQNNIDLIV